MQCVLCASKNQVRLNAELVLTSAKLESVLRDTPLYLMPKPVVCFDCGFAKIKIPKAKLKLLKGKTKRKSSIR